MLSILLPNHKETGIHEFMKQIEDIFSGQDLEIIVCKDSESKGKGWALREAFIQSKGDLVAFLDGDGEIPARMLLRLLSFIDDFDVAVGSKRITYSPLRRKIMTRLTRLWFKFLYGVKCDTQTGIKLFRRCALSSLGSKSWESNGFIFDAEIIARLQKYGFKMVEVPIECEIRRQLAFKTIWTIFKESLWLKWRLLFL